MQPPWHQPHIKQKTARPFYGDIPYGTPEPSPLPPLRRRKRRSTRFKVVVVFLCITAIGLVASSLFWLATRPTQYAQQQAQGLLDALIRGDNTTAYTYVNQIQAEIDVPPESADLGAGGIAITTSFVSSSDQFASVIGRVSITSYTIGKIFAGNGLARVHASIMVNEQEPESEIDFSSTGTGILQSDWKMTFFSMTCGTMLSLCASAS